MATTARARRPVGTPAPPREAGKEQVDWPRWMRGLGRQHRRMREFLGLSQEQLARMAGVSQGAVSRLEAGRGLATPMLVILKIDLAMRRAVRGLDPSLLNDDLRRALEIEQRLSPPVGDVGFEALPLTRDPRLEDLVRLFRNLPERQREAFFSLARATAAALASGAPAADEQKA